MKNQQQISHDILNILERLRIMHDLVRTSNFEQITKEEISNDLTHSLKELEENFKDLLQY
jgi:hypothetical protein